MLQKIIIIIIKDVILLLEFLFLFIFDDVFSEMKNVLKYNNYKYKYYYKYKNMNIIIIYKHVYNYYYS